MKNLFRTPFLRFFLVVYALLLAIQPIMAGAAGNYPPNVRKRLECTACGYSSDWNRSVLAGFQARDPGVCDSLYEGRVLNCGRLAKQECCALYASVLDDYAHHRFSCRQYEFVNCQAAFRDDWCPDGMIHEDCLYLSYEEWLRRVNEGRCAEYDDPCVEKYEKGCFTEDPCVDGGDCRLICTTDPYTGKEIVGCGCEVTEGGDGPAPGRSYPRW